MSEAIEEKGEILLIAQDSVSGTAKERTKAVTEITANYPNVKVVETIYMDQFDDLKMQAAADELGVTKEQLAEWTVNRPVRLRQMKGKKRCRKRCARNWKIFALSRMG